MKTTLIAIVILVIVGTAGYFGFNYYQDNDFGKLFAVPDFGQDVEEDEDDTGADGPGPSAPVACTADAKICPDGSGVGHVGPNCEFAQCPVFDNGGIDQSLDKQETDSKVEMTAYIKSIEGDKIVFDDFSLLIGESAEKAVVEDGKCTDQEINEGFCFPNGVRYFRNLDSSLQSFTLSSNVVIKITSAFDKSPNGIYIATPVEFKRDYVDKENSEGEKLRELVGYKIIVSNGLVVEIEEIFVP